MSSVSKTETRQVEVTDTYDSVVCDGCWAVAESSCAKYTAPWPDTEGWMKVRFPWPETDGRGAYDIPAPKDLCPACASKVVAMFPGLGA